MKKKLPVIITVIALIVLTGLCIFFQVVGKSVKKNTSYVEGNTAGNLYNWGLFCEQGGKVYFSNGYDNGALYSMNPDETGVTKLMDVSVKLVNADENYIYYFQTSSSGASGLGYARSQSGICRSTLSGKKPVNLTSQTAFCIQLVNNDLYYLVSDKSGPHFLKQNIDGSEPELLSNDEIFPADVLNGVIYYNGRETDHELYAYDTATGQTSSVWAGNLWNPIVMDGWVYYMDIANNYRLCRYSLSQNYIEVLTDDRLDMYNIGSGKIFYQKSSSKSPALIRMNLDGSDKEIIAEGVYSDINMTSQYVYFHPFGSEVPIYHVPINGPAFLATFDSAREAVLTK